MSPNERCPSAAAAGSINIEAEEKQQTREIDKIGSEIRQIDAKPAKVGRVAGLTQERSQGPRPPRSNELKRLEAAL